MRHLPLICACLLLGFSAGPQAGFFDDLMDSLKGGGNGDSAPTTVSELTQSEAAAGLRQALERGARSAVEKLGQPGGFLDNAEVRIPVPPQLESVAVGLRTLGQEDLANRFVASMNHAAERAVPIAADVFVATISSMTVDDALGVLRGGDTAATDYLRRTSADTLRQRFAPVVDQVISEGGVTRTYQQFLGAESMLGQLSGGRVPDLNDYVTDRALDGVFYMIAQEETRIRENPAARGTELLEKVFGAVR